ncbi:ABC transporter ATP-binding protein [Hydrogenobacter hydrogenophilus]|uniref:ATP-binding cassette, subfamily C/ATP-binding cassette, subfamily B, MsbA n=1 Tax=Hydrogenobacter hydrogenophilus TaxID=35835 RepID=A0A285NSC9_9AQUI|nr:ABC transporter ATP-binding protein [Hydrogenobacter hydrogenophilus]SNZ12088.1 ATP-binding cassette, subfamily C/ATP-binding cassette, subfamily B, MsbA [Hydrogenobacter hydrogenophilus]
MDNVKWLLLRLKSYWYLILFALLGSLLESAGTTGISLVVKNLVNNVFLVKNYQELIKVVLFLLAFAFLNQLGNFLASIFINLYSELEVKKTRKEVFNRLLKAQYGVLSKNSSGDIITRFISDMQAYRSLLGDHLPKLFRDPITVVALLGVLFYRDWLLTTLLGVLLPLLAFAVRYFGHKKGKYIRRLQENVGMMTQSLTNVLKGYENIKTFSSEQRFLRWFEDFNERVFKAGMKSTLYSTTNSVFNFALGYLVVSVIILYGGVRVIQGDLTPGDFVSYITALFLIHQPLTEVQKGLMEVKASIPILTRIRELLHIPQETSGDITFQGLKEGINIRDLRIKLGPEILLKGINLEIKKGEKIGIIGHTGSGKTTFLRALAGLLLYEGSIKYDEVELKEINKESFRRRIGFFTQQPFIFAGSVRENLLIAKPDANDQEIKRALELSACDFVKSLDEPLEEGGRNLSGGEMQRLTLARLFLKNPDIIFLDEATSAMDVKTEQIVLKNIFEFFKDKTIILVAHRFSNILLCDRVLAFKDGKIMAQGNPQQVIQFFLQQ